jgi:hypothetical protein
MFNFLFVEDFRVCLSTSFTRFCKTQPKKKKKKIVLREQAPWRERGIKDEISMIFVGVNRIADD